MTRRERYENALKSYNRTVGYYKRYGINASAGEFDKKPKRVSEAMIRRIEKARELARTKGQIDTKKTKKQILQ